MKYFLIFLKFIFITLLLFSCSESETKPEEQIIEKPEDKNYFNEPVLNNKYVIYQMLTRLFGNTNTNNKKWGSIEENGVGKFNDITDIALQELKKFGVTHVWYTGVLEHMVCNDYTKYGIPLDDADIVKGRAGSPYAIKDYYDVNPDLAVDVKNRKQEFSNLIKRTHDNGLKVIIDFVPNHVARNYKSDAKPQGVEDLGEKDDKTKAFDPNNNFYYIPDKEFIVPKGNLTPGPGNTFPTKDSNFIEIPAKATGNDVFKPDPNVSDWFETVKINYGVDILNKRKKYFDPIPNTWFKMRDILIYWTKFGVDGFRCDMAEMVPVEFWAWAIPQIKSINSNVIFIAEIYVPGFYKDYIFKGKFDFLYDKVGLYDTLRPLLQGKGSVKSIVFSWSGLKNITSYMLRFLENHDEQRIASKAFAKDPWRGIPGMVICATLSSGPVLIYFGQDVGEPAKGAEGFQGDDGRTTIFDYWGVPEHQKWMNYGKFDGGLLSEDQKNLRNTYAKLLNLIKTNKAISEGRLYDLYFANIKGQSKNYDDEKLYCYLRYTDKDNIALIVVNFNISNKINTFIKIPENFWTNVGLRIDKKYILKDLFTTDTKIEFYGANVTNRDKTDAGIPISINPMSAYIFEMKEID